MISERAFCANFSTFWRETLPNLEAVVRGVNLGYERFREPLISRVAAERRDLISETTYRVFFKAAQHSETVTRSLIDEAGTEAFAYLRTRVTHLWNDVFYLSDSEYLEISEAYEAIRSHFRWNMFNPSKIMRPAFRGHGIVSNCEGDFSTGDSLHEMKYVDRSYRGNDLKQLLVYSALQFFETGDEFETLFLFNPFYGTSFKTSVQDIVFSAAGISSIEFYNRVSYALSSGEISH